VKTAADSTIVIAGFASWHLAHAAALEVLAMSPLLPTHAGLEAYSVLTRLPAPHRASGDSVRAFLERAFPGEWLALPGASVKRLVDEFVERGISGGATYDALIGATARWVGATLYTCDRRARGVYDQLEVDVRFVG
jgi:predicted nucleic acid-binding protein